MFGGELGSTFSISLNLTVMKKIFSISLLLTVTLLNNDLFCQVNISCNYREVCKWNYDTKNFDSCYSYEENSLFKINKNETMFTHITEDIKSAYYIDTKTQDDETGVFMVNVESDAGNEYIYFFDFKNNEIRVATESEGELIMIRFYIKRVWTD